MFPLSADVISEALDLMLRRLSLASSAENCKSSQDETHPNVIARSDKMIEGLRAVCTQLCDDLNNRIATISKQRNTSVPISQLPPELHAEILLEATKDAKARSVSRLLELAHVATRWREVVRSTPQLWARTLDLMAGPQAIGLALQLSATAPLSIIYSPTLVPSDEFLRVEEHLRILGTHANRWRSLEFRSPDFTAVAPYLNSPLPSLEALELEYLTSAHASFIRSAIHECPRLKRLHLSRVSLPLIHLKTLEDVSLCGVSLKVEDLLDFLRPNENLHYLELLTIRRPREAITPPPSPSRLALPHLSSLRLIGVEPHIVTTLLSTIDSRGLSTLHATNQFKTMLGQTMLSAIGQGTEPSLPRQVIENSPLTLLLLRWHNGTRGRLRITGYHDAEVALDITLPGITWPGEVQAAMEMLGNTTAPINLILDRSGTAIDPAYIGELRTLTKLVIQLIPEASGILRYLTEPQRLGDGTLQWPCPDLTEIQIPREHSMPDPHLPNSKSKLTLRRGQNGTWRDWRHPLPMGPEDHVVVTQPVHALLVRDGEGNVWPSGELQS